MLIVNKERLDLSAIDDPKHKQHEQAKEYDRGLKQLKSLYKDGKLTLIRTGYPKFVNGIDALGRDIQDVKEPTPLARYPLQTYYSHPKRGKELWGVCMGEPKILPGNLWDIGDKRSFSIEERLIVDINQEPDFAYYLYFLCRAVKGGHLKIDDPKADIRAKGDMRRQTLERETAIWQSLNDEDQLRKMAQAYGVANVKNMEPDAIRFELENILKQNDELKKRDPSYKGTKEFLDEMKITDYVRLSSFIRYWLDEGMITYKPDGRYRVGDKVIAQVPTQEITKKFPWLCNYFSAPNNNDKLSELIHDLVNKEYLDGITDPKDFRWLAKSLDIQGYFNQKEDKVKEMVYEALSIV